MDIKYHVGLTSVLAGILYPFFGWNALFLFVGGVLVDGDHFFWYIFKFRSLNISHCYKKFSKGGDKKNFREFDGILLVCHTVEFIAALIALSYFFEQALLALIGYVGHAVLDFFWHYSIPKRMISNPSVLNWVWVNKIQKR